MRRRRRPCGDVRQCILSFFFSGVSKVGSILRDSVWGGTEGKCNCEDFSVSRWFLGKAATVVDKLQFSLNDKTSAGSEIAPPLPSLWEHVRRRLNMDCAQCNENFAIRDLERPVTLFLWSVRTSRLMLCAWIRTRQCMFIMVLRFARFSVAAHV